MTFCHNFLFNYALLSNLDHFCECFCKFLTCSLTTLMIFKMSKGNTEGCVILSQVWLRLFKFNYFLLRYNNNPFFLNVSVKNSMIFST
jgi:hypothetical protein